MSLKKQKLLKRKYEVPWDTDLDLLQSVKSELNQIKYYVNDKCYDLPKNFKQNLVSTVRVYGIKHVDSNNHSFWPEVKNYNVFEKFSEHEFVLKMRTWYGLYVDGVIKNPLVYTPIYNETFDIICSVGHARLLFKYAVGDKIPFSKDLEYPAYYYDYTGAELNVLENILGEDNLELVDNIVPEFTRKRTYKGPKLIAPYQNMNWIDGWNSHRTKFWEYVHNSKYELHFYRNNELQFNFKLNKKPLRINIDSEGLYSWIGFCQATLWFFFGIDTWSNDEKYFSIGD